MSLLVVFVLLTENHITNNLLAITQQRCSFLCDMNKYIHVFFFVLFFSTAASQPSSTTYSASSISGTGMHYEKRSNMADITSQLILFDKSDMLCSICRSTDYFTERTDQFFSFPKDSPSINVLSISTVETGSTYCVVVFRPPTCLTVRITHDTSIFIIFLWL